MNQAEKGILKEINKRIHYIFNEFDNVMLGLSASAESTLLLDLTLKIRKEHYKHKNICVFNVDTEIAHSYSVLHLMDTFENIREDAECYWIMLPTKIKHNLFGKDETFLAWDDSLERLLRPYPILPYVITLENNPIDSYRHGMPVKMLASSFLKWYKQCHGGKTVCLSGSRLEELHNTDKFEASKKKYRNIEWLSMNTSEIWHGSPLFDLTLVSLWRLIHGMELKYNKIYDLLYLRGDSLENFRITPPLNKENYKEIRRFAELDGIIWNELCKRIKDIEIYSTYSDPRPLFEAKTTREKTEN